ncbi:MAG: complex I subunit 5 family protein [Pseudomonadota bacterium]
MNSWLIVLTPLLPLLLALPLSVARWRSAALAAAPWAALPAFILALRAGDAALDAPWLLLGMRFGVDAVARAFLLFSAPLWLIAGFYARAYLAHDAQRARFTAFFLVTLSGNLGLILAQDIAGFYLFFALLTFAAYGLVVHANDAAAWRAGRVYLIMAVLGEALLLAGFILTADASGTLLLAAAPAAVAQAPARDLIIGLLLAGFGVKAGVILLHMWLPLAHAAAPTPASAMLSGPIIKAGLLGWLRFLPLGHAALPEWGALCIGAGAVALFYGVAFGLAQHNPKTVLAYSSVSQMGFITIALGAGLAAPATAPLAMSAALVYAAHHAAAKGALFLGVGAAQVAHRRRWVFAGLLLPALALAGAPFTGGAAAKFYLKEAAPAWETFDWLLPLAALGTTLLMARFFVLLARAPRAHESSAQRTRLLAAWCAALLAAALLVWRLPQIDAAALLAHWRTPAAWLDETWPLLAGVLIALPAARYARAVQLPPGDALVVVETSLRALARAGENVNRALLAQRARWARWSARLWKRAC